MKFDELDAVKTCCSFPERGIEKGETGTVFISFNNPNEAYKVKFVDTNGRPKAIFAILPNDLEKAVL